MFARLLRRFYQDFFRSDARAALSPDMEVTVQFGHWSLGFFSLVFLSALFGLSIFTVLICVLFWVLKQGVDVVRAPRYDLHIVQLDSERDLFFHALGIFGAVAYLGSSVLLFLVLLIVPLSGYYALLVHRE